jgi:transcriptional repressor NrdR
VVDSREARDGDTIRRRRECLECGRRFTSYEQIEDIAYMVVKRDGRHERFSRQKLLAGLTRACEKRPVSPKRLEELADDLEARLQEREDRSISSQEIGNLLMDRLRELDQVAYVRFASVYRRFEDIEAFTEMLGQLVDKTQGRSGEVA